MAELLVVPLKSSSDVDIVKPLHNLIQSTYSGENTEEYTDALNELARLRNNAIWKVFEKSSLEVIYSYYDQLVSLQSKIPPQEVQIPFKWKDAFDKGSIFGGRRSLTVSSLAYERMCVLFNIAALQSATAASKSLNTEESLKLAATMLQKSAGIFDYLKSNIMAAVHQDTTPDLQPETLGALSALMLAQAQEVILHKCIRDELKEVMVARLAAQCEELYTDALRAFSREHLKPLWDKDWLPTIQAKQATFRGLAQYYQSLVCRSKKAVGEEIARLQCAVELLKSAQNRLPSWSLLQEMAGKAARNLAAAIKDNDFIYHERIPEPAQLESITRTPIAKCLPLPEKWSTNGKDLFAGLLPLAVQQALTTCAAKRGEAVNAEVNALRESTQLLNSILASLNLPAAIEQTAGAGLPESIRQKARAVKEAGGLASLQALMSELPELLQRNKDILDEADRMLREEEESDSALRSQFGARWSRTESAKLTETFKANAAKYRQIIDNAIRADNIVQQKFQHHKESFRLLSGSEEDMGADVPDAPDRGPQDANAIQKLRKLMEQVETIKAERDVIESELKDVRLDMRTQFLSALAQDGAIDEPALTASALPTALAPLSKQARESIRRQEQLVADIQHAHAGLVSSDAGGRDAALGTLCAAHDAYHDLRNNLTEGVKFYNDLTQLLVAFQNKVSDFCFARKTEKEELLKDLTQDASRGASRPAPAPPAHHADSIQEPVAVARREPPPRPPPPATAPQPAAAAQLPYPMQPQGMPLPYAAPGMAPYPYYAAPMPTAYNPYATLPYPHHYRGVPPAAPYQPYQYPQGTQHPQQPPGYNPYQQQ